MSATKQVRSRSRSRSPGPNDAGVRQRKNKRHYVAATQKNNRYATDRPTAVLLVTALGDRLSPDCEDTPMALIGFNAATDGPKLLSAFAFFKKQTEARLQRTADNHAKVLAAPRDGKVIAEAIRVADALTDETDKHTRAVELLMRIVNDAVKADTDVHC